uniref:non-specific serine/threonine protein kinase n=1 Tax=Lotharella globosa TaxID=91324 RepID=A0A6V3JXX0_9EUKA|mmetsp:Transcript_31695/g.61302  ORF Transcript_31695/g.61302 Transcript_31695/m.61302 type:complete len:675 (-) Transcript_31695:75-2099(-)|eukprot:CAMPEP_0167801600 /NCGR_PEP_ID=MMETSP0111_2-20121227/18536_1 /TAXON_ID=91324 /ORGANISM="Lotharella globosa, Strain CCCM811" /LENGTH=674 /DNA_ID=CAMNT_0007697307 /DNA_START=96 /DNA_END=2120 /DNA_ORIENTATION=+
MRETKTLGSVRWGGYSEEQLAQKLLTPAVFSKHISKSRPHRRFVVCSADFKEVRWAATPSKLNGRSKFAKVGALQKVLRGRHTPAFATSLDKTAEGFCFSLVFASRTLDLHCATTQERNLWVSAFMWLLDKEKERRSGVGKPYNVKHVSHVNTDWEWSNVNLEKEFMLGRRLGKGSFGVVNLGFHRGSGMQMAIKMIDCKANGEKPEDIKAEVEVLKKCRHQGVVSFYGCAGPDKMKRLWILMELCGGGSLRDLLDTFGPMEEYQIQYIAAHALKALIYLHGREIIHRDLKAGNILLTDQGEVKITDFGISLSLGGRDKELSKVKGLAGSPLWMPPEIIAGRGASYLSDVWSLGITLIELKEGIPPHAYKNSMMEVLRAVKNDPPPQLSRGSREFKSILGMMLKKDPKSRTAPMKLLAQPFISKALYASAGGEPSPLKSLVSKRLRLRKSMEKERTMKQSHERSKSPPARTRKNGTRKGKSTKTGTPTTGDFLTVSAYQGDPPGFDTAMDAGSNAGMGQFGCESMDTVQELSEDSDENYDYGTGGGTGIKMADFDCDEDGFEEVGYNQTNRTGYSRASKGSALTSKSFAKQYEQKLKTNRSLYQKKKVPPLPPWKGKKAAPLDRIGSKMDETTRNVLIAGGVVGGIWLIYGMHYVVGLGVAVAVAYGLKNHYNL